MQFKIDHIGIVVSSLKKKIFHYKKNFGYLQITKKIIEPAHNVELVFVGLKNSFVAIELIRPLSKKSKVYNFLKNNGEGLHHIAYEVTDLNKAIDRHTKNGSIVVSPVVKGAGHNKTKTIWLYTSDKQLIELIEKQKKIKSNFDRFTK